MKVGGVILCQKFYQNIKTFDDVITTMFLFSAPFGKRKVQNPNFFVFHLIYFKFGVGGNCEMLIAKRKPKLKLENELSKKWNFLPILTKIISSTLQQ